MRYYIWKLPVGNMDWGREIKGDTFNIDARVPVWTGWLGEADHPDLISNFLDGLYSKFNRDIPDHYAAPSMSVGDIIQIIYSDKTVYYAVQCIGFKEVKPYAKTYSD